MGSTAEWAGVVVGLGALLAAIYAGYYGARLYGVEAGRDEKERERRAREEPSRVNAWQAVRTGEGSPKYGLVVANRGENPVYDVDVEATTWAKGTSPAQTEQRPLRLRVVPPGTYFFEHVGGTYHWDYGEDVDAVNGTVRPVMKSRKLGVPGMEFTDASGERWRRDDYGRLDRAVATAPTGEYRFGDGSADGAH